MAELRKEKSLKETKRGRRDFSPLHFALPLAGHTHLLLFFFSFFYTPLFLRFSCLPLSVSLRGESRAICIRCHNSVRNKLRPSCWLSPQHAWHFNGDCQLQERWIPPLLYPSLHSFRKRVMQIDTFSMNTSASDRCSLWNVSFGCGFLS